MPVLVNEGGVSSPVITEDVGGSPALPALNSEQLTTVVGASDIAPGKAGIVPVPAAGDHLKQLRGDGTWQYPSEAQVVRVAKSGAPFTSIKAAVDSIVDASSSKQYVVLVAPGVYAEDPITMQSYVNVVGAGPFYSTEIQANSNGAHLITGASASSIANVSLSGPTSAGFAAVYHAVSSNAPFICDRILVKSGYYGFWCDPTGSRGIIHLFYCGNQYSGSQINQFVRATQYGVVIGMNTGFMSGPSSAVVYGYYASGPNAAITLDLCSFANSAATPGSGVPTAVFGDDGADVRLTACAITRGDRGIWIGSTGSATSVFASGCVIRDAVGTHVKTDSLTGVVSYDGGQLKRSALDLISDDTLVGSFSNAAAGEGQVVIGELYLGTLAESIPLTSLTRSTAPTGHHLGGVLTRGTGLQVAVSSGSGFINTGTSVVHVAWGAATPALSANASAWVYVDSAGTVQTASSEPSYLSVILLGHAMTNASGITFLSSHVVEIDQAPARLRDYLEEVIGPISVSGCLASINGPPSLQLDVGSGSFFISNQEFAASTGTAITFISTYRNGSGGLTYVTGQTNVDTGFYDDGSGTLAAIPGGKYVKHLLFVNVSGDGTEYHLVYGQTLFDSQTLAESGVDPTWDAELLADALRVAGVVVLSGDTQITSVVDERPRLGQYSTNATTTQNHGDLTGLSADDHVQYLLANGTRAMSGSLNMGSGNITSVGTVDGRDVSVDGAALDAHIANTSNPHATTAAQVGAIPTSEKAAASGVASLDASSKVVQDPANASTTSVASGIPKADGSGKIAAGWIQQVISLTDLTDVTAKTGSGTTVVLQGAPTLTGTVTLNKSAVDATDGLDLNVTAGSGVGLSINMTGGSGLAILAQAGSISCPQGSTGERFGSGAVASALSVAFGNGAQGNASGTVALGAAAAAGFAGSIALGNGATTTTANQLVIGSTTQAISSVYLGNGVTAAAPSGATVSVTGSATATVAGGSLTQTAGTGNTTGAGGLHAIQGGVGGVGGVGGSVQLNGGLAGQAAEAGGEVVIQTAKAGAGTTLVERFRVTSDGALDATGIATASLPAVSAASHGRICFDSTTGTFKASLSGGAYVNLVSLQAAYNGGAAISTGTNGSVTITGSGANNDNALEISKTPAGAQSGSGLVVTMGANATAPAAVFSGATSSSAVIHVGNGVSAATPVSGSVLGTSATAAATAGGGITLQAGAGNTSGAGGLVTIQGGTGGATGNGSNVLLNGGIAGAASGTGGAIVLQTAAAAAGATLVERLRIGPDGGQESTGVATADAPSVSGAGNGKLYYNSTQNRYLASENGGAYRNAFPFQQSVASTTTITTTSTSYVLASAMTITPEAGTYMVWFSSTAGNSGGTQSVFLSVYSGGAQATGSERRIFPNAAALGSSFFPFCAVAVVTVDGSQAIEGRWRVTGGTGSMLHKTLIVMRIA